MGVLVSVFVIYPLTFLYVTNQKKSEKQTMANRVQYIFWDFPSTVKLFLTFGDVWNLHVDVRRILLLTVLYDLQETINRRHEEDNALQDFCLIPMFTKHFSFSFQV